MLNSNSIPAAFRASGYPIVQPLRLSQETQLGFPAMQHVRYSMLGSPNLESIIAIAPSQMVRRSSDDSFRETLELAKTNVVKAERLSRIIPCRSIRESI